MATNNNSLAKREHLGPMKVLDLLHVGSGDTQLVKECLQTKNKEKGAIFMPNSIRWLFYWIFGTFVRVCLGFQDLILLDVMFLVGFNQK